MMKDVIVMGAGMAGLTAARALIPRSKKLALDKIKMGPVMKVLLLFKERFWPKWVANIGCGVGPVTLYWPTAYKRDHDLPVLTAYATGPRAVQLAAVSETEAVAIITADR